MRTERRPTRNLDAESPPPSPLTPAAAVAWIMGASRRPPYKEVRRAGSRSTWNAVEHREAWLRAIFGKDISFEIADYDVRKLSYQLLKNRRPYTVPSGDNELVVTYDTRTHTVRGKRERRRTEKSRALILAELFVKADGQVGFCPECYTWYVRSTQRQKFCNAKCAARDRTRRARRRAGRIAVRRVTLPASSYTPGASTWSTAGSPDGWVG